MPGWIWPRRRRRRSVAEVPLLGRAIGDARNQWPALLCHVGDGRLAISNNAAERALLSLLRGRAQELALPPSAKVAAGPLRS